MTRTFIYARCSTVDQHPENQILEIETAGFEINKRRVIIEHISGGTPARERPGLARLLDRLEDGDTLVVSRLDRLGRDAVDIVDVVETLASAGVRVYCLQLGGTDLTSPSGRMIMTVLAAMARFEKDLLRERTAAGLARAKAEGKRLGRPPALNDAQQHEVLAKLASGSTLYALAKEFKVDRRSLRRMRDKANATA